MLLAVNYHYIRPSFDYTYPGIHGVSPSQFEEQLKMLGSVGTFVSGEQIRAATLNGRVLPPKSIIVTFDDGLREQYENAWPILQRLNIPAIFFINTAAIVHSKILPVHKVHLLRAHVSPEDFQNKLAPLAAERGIDLDLHAKSEEALFHYNYDSPEVARLKYCLNFRLSEQDRDVLIELMFAEVFPGREAEMSKQLYMDCEQIRELGSRGFIGSHSHDHLPLGLLSDEIAENQIQLAQSYLAEWAGYTPFALSYPYGSRDSCCEKVGNIAAKLGISFALTMERAANIDLAQPFHLARFDCNDLPGGKSSKWNVSNLFEELPAANWYR